VTICMLCVSVYSKGYEICVVKTTNFNRDENVSKGWQRLKYSCSRLIIKFQFTPCVCVGRFTNCEALGKASWGAMSSDKYLTELYFSVQNRRGSCFYKGSFYAALCQLPVLTADTQFFSSLACNKNTTVNFQHM
jgi:hypothetical protein